MWMCRHSEVFCPCLVWAVVSAPTVVNGMVFIHVTLGFHPETCWLLCSTTTRRSMFDRVVRQTAVECYFQRSHGFPSAYGDLFLLKLTFGAGSRAPGRLLRALRQCSHRAEHRGPTAGHRQGDRSPARQDRQGAKAIKSTILVC